MHVHNRRNSIKGAEGVVTGFEACDSSQREHRACGTSQANAAAGRNPARVFRCPRRLRVPGWSSQRKKHGQSATAPITECDKERKYKQNRCWRGRSFDDDRSRLCS
jgi:hypothetical protein